ncbi:VWA domain-containing protein [Flavobacterium sp. ZT3R18]|uniref:VWA domain-containing protein n=1 Tax=Flavobacterium sp. ZT3R18 TaxID=2594429 RepID=UPI001179EA93|nr:VWA domain-containing protein [Flavobacterium sp. ZT3R18]TRX33704.1 VWA domain-containing protein [Flavobacterium sp. ZT3R18]
MTNCFKIKKYWILTFCLVLCSLATFAQDLSDQQIGFDVARTTTMLKEHGVKEQDMDREIALTREMQKSLFVISEKISNEIKSKIIKGQIINNKSSGKGLVTAKVSDIEREALVALYKSTNGSKWENTERLWDVNNPNSDVSTWFGVRVFNGSVISLYLNNNNLDGFIPKEIGALKSLTYLSLAYNKLIGELPSTIGNLKSLQFLSLNFNQFSGKIPQEMNFLKDLKSLGLGTNQFTGELPTDFMDSVDLEWLGLAGNNFEGTIPSGIFKMNNLKFLQLQNCQFSGFPVEIGTMPLLEHFYLHRNKLQGKIPSQIGSYKNLIMFELQDNQLSGGIPPEFGNLLNLNSLRVYSNKLSGPIPKIFTSLAKLKSLNFSYNNFRFVDFFDEYQTNMSKFLDFSYIWQSKTDSEKTVAGVSGNTVTLTMCEDGRYVPNVDTFQWFKNGVAVTDVSINNRSYTISNLSAANAGDYYCVSKNPQITDLTLQRHPIHLSVTNCTPKEGELKVMSEKLSVNETVNFSFLEMVQAVGGKTISALANKDSLPGTKYTWTITDETGKEVSKQETTTTSYGYAFTTPGKYLVKLDIIDENGCPANIPAKEVIIKAQVLCLNENILFSFETTAPNLSYVWTSTNAAGVVVNSSMPSPSSLYNVSFAIPGDYTITMVATDTATQCSETFIKKVTVASCAPTYCTKVHFNFNFKIPDIKKGFGGLVLNLDSRMNIANGIVDFMKNSTNKKLFATTFDLSDKGTINAVIVNKEITVSPGDVYKVGTTNDISNNKPTVIRIQDQTFSNSFTTLINNGILKNTSLKKEDPVDVSFFIISEDHNTATLDGAKRAYQDLLASGKAKKIFFVLVNEGKFSYITKRVGLPAKKTFITPVEFLTEMMGSVPVNYSDTNSILSSDYVQFSKLDIAKVGFKEVLTTFLEKGHKDVLALCVDVQSCTKDNKNTPVLKKLLLNLANKLKDIPDGSDANTYAQKEIAAFAPYTVDKKPIIYNVINTASTISFSFSESGLENDVQLPKPVSGSIVDIDLSQYTDATTKTPVITAFSNGKSDATNGFVRNIDFCIKELSCVSHVALVLDESGSIDSSEMNKIKKQLKRFVYQQGVTNEKIGSNIHVSLTGMSDSDTNTRTDYVEPIKASTDILVLGKFYDWIDNLGMRNGQTTGISASSDYWKSGLDGALSYTLKPDVVIMITDGCQTADVTTLKTTMSRFNNAKGSSPESPHLYVVGIENGFYVDRPSTGKTLDRNEDPNYNPALQKRSLTGKVAARLTKSLHYLLGFPETEFPVSSIIDFKNATYFGHDNFNLLASDETYFSDKLIDNEIICGTSAVKDFCDDCFSFKPEPGHEYLISAWVKEESFTQVKSYMNSAINIVFYRQKEALDVPGHIIATETANPSGEIIDGWQRIVWKFKVPTTTITIGFSLENKSASIPVYFDDIRIHPLTGSIKSFVYDPETFKLMSELDENNYSTFYEYDNEGGLVRVKKETAKGVKTIQETRSGSYINTKE